MPWKHRLNNPLPPCLDHFPGNAAARSAIQRTVIHLSANLASTPPSTPAKLPLNLHAAILDVADRMSALLTS